MVVWESWMEVWWRSWKCVDESDGSVEELKVRKCVDESDG